jgi:hypothetical protein
MSAGLASKEDRIRDEFDRIWKEYSAFDRTLDALSALTFALNNIREIKQETELINFTPRLEAVDLDGARYTPDGLVIQKHCDFVLELKTSWNDADIKQILKYARSAGYFLKDDSKRQFKSDKCVLLGYQNPPGDERLDKLFQAWEESKISCPLVVFRYSLEQGPEERMYFARIAHDRNGRCPTNSKLGQAINSSRGFPVKTDNYKFYRPKFHKTNDQVIASYAAVLWWTKYARHYLSEEQKSEMAERGRLTSPFTILWNKIDEVPAMPGTDVPLGPSDVRRALEFLQEAKLVKLKKKARAFEIVLKEDRFIRLPQGIPVPRAGPDMSVKILGRWASNRVKKPPKKPKQPRKIRRRRGGGRDDRTLPMFH